MTEGYNTVFAGREMPIYLHLSRCEALDAKLAAESAAALEANKAVLRVQRANLPDDIDGIGDLAGYQSRFKTAAATRKGITLCERFHAACASDTFPKMGFTLTGSQGGGKSTLIQALGRSLLASRIDVRYEFVPDFYTEMLGALRRDDFEGELRRRRSFRVLILDDLAREKPSPWWVDQVLFPLVDFRYRQGLPTVITSNYDWEAMETIYAGARSERGETAHSAPQLVDRLLQKSAAVTFGAGVSNRKPDWDFMQ